MADYSEIRSALGPSEAFLEELCDELKKVTKALAQLKESVDEVARAVYESAPR